MLLDMIDVYCINAMFSLLLNCVKMVLLCDLQLSAVDSDAGPNGRITYRILAGDHGQFVINNR